MINATLLHTVGHCVNGDDMHYITVCPYCSEETEWTGYFDSSDVHECRSCQIGYMVDKVWLNDGEYIQ